MAGKQTLADPAKGIIHRSRFALGDIGNRLTQKGAVAAGPEKKGLQPGKTGAAGTTNHKPPTSLAPSHNVPNPNAKGAKQLGRSNSTLGATNNAQGPKPARPRLVSRLVRFLNFICTHGPVLDLTYIAIYFAGANQPGRRNLELFLLQL